MDNVRHRLIKCFSTVFPELATEDIVKLTPDGPAAWDSLSAVTLLALVEEEFGTNLDVDSIETCQSFDAMLARVVRAKQKDAPLQPTERE